MDESEELGEVTGIEGVPPMSNADIVRASFAAYAAGDFEALRGMMQPDLEVHDWPEAADPNVFRGTAAIEQAQKEWGKAWESSRAEPLDIVEAGDRVLAVMRFIGKGRGSTIEMELTTYGVYTIREAKVAKIQFFTDREGALAAAGLTDDQLKQEAR